MKTVFAFIYLMFSSFPALAQDVEPKFPPNEGAVNDFANVLSTDTKDKIRSMAAGLRDTKGPCVVVVTTPSLYGLTVEDYTNQLFKKWQIGHKNDDGLIFLIATGERKMRIEVGYGLEPTIPDLVAKAILADKVKPWLAQKPTPKWDEGVLAGTQAIITKLGGAAEGSLPEPAPILNKKPIPTYKPSVPWYLTWWGLIIIVIGIILLIAILINDPTGLSGAIIGGMLNSSGGGGGGGGRSSGGGSRESSSSGGGSSGGGGASDSF